MNRKTAVLQFSQLAANAGMAGVLALALALGWYVVQQLQGAGSRLLAQ